MSSDQSCSFVTFDETDMGYEHRRQNAVGLVALASQRPTSGLTAPYSYPLITSHAWHNPHPTPAPFHTHHNAAGGGRWETGGGRWETCGGPVGQWTQKLL
ncbi:hypothetical protein E2C01_005036 [Portunus trituberculatus]|uniref:Uncharacterized protein n=1 Tax=Portunus trituberculatus TaxID=210409 RepID=A0A5B7CT73_PORTR|nr:hypothetical protein [Portunus trituberculatus]